MMKTYHGERSEHGCKVTVDFRPLRMRSDLSGNATTPFDWGYVGSGQLSLALLADFFGSDVKAKAMSDVFEKHVIAILPDVWTLTDYAIATALAPLVGVDGARAGDVEPDGVASPAFGDMPMKGTLQAEDASAAGSMVSEGGPLASR
jgi:hypothetical protein